MRRGLVIVVLVVLIPVGLHAQTSGNVFAGYSFLSNDLHAEYLDGRYGTYYGRGRGNLNGWNFSAEIKVFHWIGAVADFSGTYGSAPINSGNLNPATSIDTHLCTYLFGPRASLQVGRMRPFAEALVGLASQGLSSLGTTASQHDSNLATAYGGGLDYRFLPRLAWRLEADYIGSRLFKNLQPFGSSTPVQRNFRFSTGIVFRL